jgi:hypothetical protein
MTDREYVLNTLRKFGKSEALKVQSKSPSMNGTELIAEEDYIPEFNPTKDYSSWQAGFPVQDEGQVWTLLQPYNAANHEGRPSTLRALWGLAHTKDALKAKPYVAPYGTSGLYMIDECCMWTDGKVYKSIIDNNAYDPEAYPAGWELIEE